MKNKEKKMADLIQIFRTLPGVLSFLYKSDRKYFFIILIETFAFAIDKYPALLIMKFTINTLTSEIAYIQYVQMIIPLLILMLVLQGIRIFSNTSYRDQVVAEKLFNEFFEKCMEFDYQTLESKETQDKKELAKHITYRKISAIGWYFVEMFSSMIALLIASIMLIGINPALLAIVIVSLVLKTLLAKEAAKKNIVISEEQVKNNRFLSYLYKIGSDYEYVKEFRIFQYKARLNKKINAEEEKYIANNNTILKNNFNEGVIGSILDFSTKLLAFLSAGYTYLIKLISLSDFIFVIGLLNDFVSYTNAFTESCKAYLDASRYIQHYRAFIGQKTDISETHSHTEITANGRHIIAFENVSFRYPNSNTYALKNMSVCFSAPQKISLVGRNGAGKSTMVKLLLRLYKPESGSITLDGRDIFAYSRDEYLALFSAVMQDYTLFAFTISENIACFNKNINHQLFTHIAQETGVEAFIRKYPHEYETYLTNAFLMDGVEMSGGEQQKIALARAMYKSNACIYILDEPASTYDADAEFMLYKKYEALLSGKASIFISHRLSSCKLSDRIIVLDGGAVVEEGSHNELMQQDSVYRRMFELQANQYKKGEGNE
jgi:ABC-type multidrug transport system fused ATPase/permease subunit